MIAAERKLEFTYRYTERLALLVDGAGPVTTEQMKLAAAEATATCDEIDRLDRKDAGPQTQLLFKPDSNELS